MSSIPLVALGVKAPQVKDYQQMQSDALGIQAQRNQNALAPGNQQLQQQQIQQQELQLEQQKQQMADQQAMTKAMNEWDPKDVEALPNLVLKHGGSAQAVMGLKSGIVKLQTDTLNMNEAQQKIEKIKNDHFVQSIDDVLALPLDQQPQAFEAAKQDAIQRGFLDPKQAQGLAYQNPDQLNMVKKTLQGHSAVLSEAESKAKIAKDQRDAATAAAELPGKVADSAIKQKELEMMNQQGGAAIGKGLDVQEANAWLKKHPGKDLNDYKEYSAKLLPQFNFNLQQGGVNAPNVPTTGAGGQPATYEEKVASMGAKGPTVKAVIEGRQTAPSGFALSKPYWQDIMNKVYAVDPQWSEQRAQLRKGYTVGQQSKEINAINTAMGHVGVLNDAIDALNNGNLKVLNQIANRFGIETGSTPAAVFKTIVHRVGPELSKAYLGAGGSAGERGADEKDFDENLPPQTLKATTGITAQLLRSKIGALENQWDENRAPGMKSFQDQFISKEAKSQLDRLNPQGAKSSGSSKPPDATHTGIGSVDKKKHWLDKNGKDLGVAE